MKKLIILSFSVFISSCGLIDMSRVAPGYAQAYTSIKQVLTGFENDIEPDLIQKIPYASMIVKIGKGPAALMILESISGDNYSWVSSDGVYLVINNGKIIKTYGLPNNLKESLSTSLTWEEYLESKHSFISYNSYDNPVLNNLKVTSTYYARDQRNVELIFGLKKLRLAEEVISSEEIAWNEVNKYWLDESDFVWKSIQYISPRLPKIFIEVTKKPL